MTSSAPARNDRSVTPVDQHVSQRIEQRRRIIGLSQVQLARQIGVSHPQMRKYEVGLDRITVGRLHGIAQALDVDVGWFFEGIAGASSVAEESLESRKMLDLVRNFAAIRGDKHKEAFAHLVRALADT